MLIVFFLARKTISNPGRIDKLSEKVASKIEEKRQQYKQKLMEEEARIQREKEEERRQMA